MALSSIIKSICKECGKIAIEKSRCNFGTSKMITLECGHITFEEVLSTKTDIATILNGCTLMPYQVAGVEFLQQSDARAILADEQGLGKTIQAIALLMLHKEQLLPAVVVCPTSVKLQWAHEIINKAGIKLVQVIGSGKELAAPGMEIYITTYDLLKSEKCFQLVQNQIKFFIIDECQKIKNHLSERAKAIQKTCKDIDHILPMSGTPIKNNAGEYFTVLNLVKPRLFPNYSRFIENDCDSYNQNGFQKIGGLRDPNGFAEKTKDFILRRTKAEVLPDLPALSRKFYHVPMDGRVKQMYLNTLKELEDLMYSEESNSFAAMGQKIAIMSKLRWITGLSKVDECVDFVTEFLLSTDRKIVIFVHHHDVVTMLEAKLNTWLTDGGFSRVLNLHAQLSAQDRANLAQRFKDEDYRVMIASTLAAGEGLNLQFCSDAVMMERQWNPANEEQAEGRFHRFGQINPVSVTYMIVSECIDEMFTEIVETKRAIVASTLDNKDINWEQNSLMAELADVLIRSGKKSWKL